MTLRTILVGYNGTLASRNALTCAAYLAKRHAAHIKVLLAHAANEDYAFEGRWIPETARNIIRRANAETIAQIETAYAAQVTELDLGDRVTFQAVQGKVDDVLCRMSRAHDLLVLGEPLGEGVDPHVQLHPDQIALRSGRPILIVPGSAESFFRNGNAAVTWDGKRAAARALSDAIQILGIGYRVTLLTGGGAELPVSTAETLSFLARHGLEGDHIHLPGEAGIASEILGWCDAHRPDLLVMGAYEHSKFRVELVGGVTSAVIGSARLPVLMSH
ncbi:universal stress protein [Tropicimonas marinistellae]|uniref:universal stress protein n=1 Tax=Tropicimonas marinistellae TaxID=1739787 RepID=UPI00082C8778|nr:universal stress protein [Tropicimonas marinistellae]